MKRLIPLFVAVVALATAGFVTAVAVGSASGGSDAAERQASGDQAQPGVAAMCAEGHPDCEDMIVGGNDNACLEGAEDCVDTYACDLDAQEDCAMVPDGAADCKQQADGTLVCQPAAPVDPGMAVDPICVDDGRGVDCAGGGSSPPSTGGGGPSTGTTYNVAVPFDASVIEEDLKLANEVVLAFDVNADFLIQESFPPIGRATLTSSDPNVCAAIESKLEGIPSVGDVTCAGSSNDSPPCCKPDAPVSSTPAGEPGVNPSQPGSAPDSGPTSE